MKSLVCGKKLDRQNDPFQSEAIFVCGFDSTFAFSLMKYGDKPNNISMIARDIFERFF
jgi:hypothetical protein